MNKMKNIEIGKLYYYKDSNLVIKILHTADDHASGIILKEDKSVTSLKKGKTCSCSVYSLGNEYKKEITLWL